MRRPPRRSPNRLGLTLLALFVVLLAGVGVAAFKSLSFVNSVSTADLGDNVRSIITTAPTAAPTIPGTVGRPPEPSGRINILLLGYGGAGHDGGELTDSIMVLTFDQQTKKAAMISVPRDIWAKIPYQGDQGVYSKINTAYAIGADDDTYPNKKAEYKGPGGGGALASSVIGGILGVKIDYWVAVDFRAFKSVVDALGGVDVDVETAFTDYQYPRNDNPDIDPGWMTVSFKAGMQHMNGDRALIFARSRHSLQDGTDFGRSRRQQKLLLAIKDKALTPDGLTKLFGLMDALSKNFKTNMNVGQMRALADMAKTADVNNIDRVSIDNTNYLVDAVSGDGQDVLIPEAKSWAPLQAHIASLELNPAVRSENATVQVLGPSSAMATTMLQDIGLQTLPAQSLDSGYSAQTEIHDLSQGKDPVTVNYLANLFGARILTETPGPNDPGVRVTLARDYQLPSSPVDALDPNVRGLGTLVAPSRPAAPVAAAGPSSRASAAPSAAAPASPSSSAASAAARPALTPTPAASVRGGTIPATPTPTRR